MQTIGIRSNDPVYEGALRYDLYHISPEDGDTLADANCIGYLYRDDEGEWSFAYDGHFGYVQDAEVIDWGIPAGYVALFLPHKRAWEGIDLYPSEYAARKEFDAREEFDAD